MKTVERKNYNIVYTDPEIYIDNESRNRSGHMSHAMVEFAPNKIIDFNSNCSPVRCDGHSAFGWIEYRISEDGHNWDEGFYISTKKAPCHYSNNIVLKNSNGENRLLIQYSDTYYKGCVNVRHMWLQIDKKN